MKRNYIYNLIYLIGIVGILAFTGKPIVGFAQESTAELLDEVIQIATSSSEVVEIATDGGELKQIETPSEVSSVEAELINTVTLNAEEELNIREDGGVLGEFTNSLATVQPEHSCEMVEFSKTLQRGENVTFTFSTHSANAVEIVKNSYFLGDLPSGITGEISPAASKEGKKYDIVFSAELFAQRGSFNIPVFYKQTDNDLESSLAVCQLNLIVE